MLKKFCDICGEEISMYCGKELILKEISGLESYGVSIWEICPSCLKEIRDFIEVLKKNG